MGSSNQSFSWAKAPPKEGTAEIHIKVIGVGGGGGNAINTMAVDGLSQVDLLAANTDPLAQMLALSQVGRHAKASPNSDRVVVTSSTDPLVPRLLTLSRRCVRRNS